MGAVEKKGKTGEHKHRSSAIASRRALSGKQVLKCVGVLRCHGRPSIRPAVEGRACNTPRLRGSERQVPGERVQTQSKGWAVLRRAPPVQTRTLSALHRGRACIQRSAGRGRPAQPCLPSSTFLAILLTWCTMPSMMPGGEERGCSREQLDDLALAHARGRPSSGRP